MQLNVILFSCIITDTGGKRVNIYVYQLLIGISTGLLYFLSAAGMAIVCSGMNVINFGQGAFYMFGTLLCYSIWNATGSFVLALVGSVLVIAIGGGFATEWLLRPLYGRPMLFQLLLTMGVGYIIQDFFVFAWGNRLISHKVPDYLDFRINLLGFKFPFYYIFLILLSLAICAVMLYVFKKTKIGMIFRAIITNRDMVSCMGVNVKLLNSVMFMVGVGLSALAGALNLPLTGTSTTAESSVMFTTMSILIIGGITEIKGAFFGSMLVGLTTTFGAMFLSQYYSMLPAVLMVLVLLIKPEGLCGKKPSA